MRDKKISLLLVVSFLLLITSVLILSTWLYNYRSGEKIITREVLQPVNAAEITRDSLLKIYTATIQSVENQLGTTYSRSDSLEASLDLKLNEYYKLKTEVAAILKNPGSTDDFKTAKYKIGELQQRLEELRNTNSSVQQENARLKRMLAQITATSGQSNQVSALPETPQQRQTAIPTAFTTAEMNLTALKPEAADEDVFNTQRNIMGSFAVKNTVTIENAEVWVVVTQPDGKVLQKSAWESGSFVSNDGKKIYSIKMNIGYTKGEAKKITFSIPTEKFMRGNYTMQIYNKGALIGKVVKMLS